MPAIGLAVLMPLAVSVQKTRRAAFFTSLAYYAGAAWPLVPGAKAFFGAESTWIGSAALWFASSTILALPYGIFWTSALRLRPIGTLAALVVTAIPPVGVIGWASPLMAAGVLFPGTAWLGLIATAAVCAFAAQYPRSIATSAGILLLITQAAYRQPNPPSSWKAVQTHFGSGFDPANPLVEFQVAESIQRTALESGDTVLIFPEMVVHRWTDATDAFWQPSLTKLRGDGKTIMVGAGLSIPGQNRLYLNSVVARGSSEADPFLQRIPVPVAMWNPLAPAEGVPPRLWSRGTITVAGQRAAVLICYEQLLVWPMLASAFENPTVLIGIANNHWATGIPIPAVQTACLRAWSRLFRLPHFSATNS